MPKQLTLVLLGFCLSVRAALIQPTFAALTWKFNGSDFWAPVHLDRARYHVQSPSGALPSALNRRGLPSGGYVPCTVVTLNSSITSLSAAAVGEVIDSYAIDDVWSAEQFMGCLYVQYDGSASNLTVGSSFTTFVQERGISTIFASPAFDFTGCSMPEETTVLSVISPCDKGNGPYVVTLPSCEGDVVAFTPVYTLHSDTYEGTLRPMEFIAWT